MSGYLQRLAQRSGLVVGLGVDRGRPTAAGSSLSTASAVRDSPGADDDPAGIGIIDRRLSVSPLSASPGSLASGVAASRSGGPVSDADPGASLIGEGHSSNESHDRPASDTGRVARARSTDTIEHHGSINRSINRLTDVTDKRGNRHRTDPEPVHVDSSARQDRDFLDDPGRSFHLSSDSGTRIQAEELAEKAGLDVGREAGGRSVLASNGAVEMDSNAPTRLIDQAIQWVMDDPHWTQQEQAPAIESGIARQLAEVPAIAGRSSRMSTQFPPGTGAGDHPVTDFASAPEAANRDAPSPEVQVHIGRVSIEIRQSEEPNPVRAVPGAPRQNGTSSRNTGSSDSRLRRLYLRGF